MKTENITFRATPTEKEYWKSIAERQGMTLSQLIRKLIKDYVKEN